MKWNYRVLRFEEMFHEGQSVQREEWYEVVEVYYDGDGKPTMYGHRTLSAETLDGLQEEADRMLQAVSSPVLDAKLFDVSEGDGVRT